MRQFLWTIVQKAEKVKPGIAGLYQQYLFYFLKQNSDGTNLINLAL